MLLNHTGNKPKNLEAGHVMIDLHELKDSLIHLKWNLPIMCPNYTFGWPCLAVVPWWRQSNWTKPNKVGVDLSHANSTQMQSRAEMTWVVWVSHVWILLVVYRYNCKDRMMMMWIFITYLHKYLNVYTYKTVNKWGWCECSLLICINIHVYI